MGYFFLVIWLSNQDATANQRGDPLKSPFRINLFASTESYCLVILPIPRPNYIQREKEKKILASLRPRVWSFT
jgi:hypothetical protein